MNENFSNPGDEIMTSAFAAMREREIPDGPGEARIVETIAALQGAEANKPKMSRWMNNRTFITGMAASLLMLIAAAAAIEMLRSPEVTCAEVIDTVRNARAMSYEMWVPSTRGDQSLRLKVLLNDQGQMEVIPEGARGVRTVVDAKSGRFILLEPMLKMAMVMNMKGLPARSSDPGLVIDGFKKLTAESAKDLGKEEIDGRLAEKFTANQMGQDYVIWADPRTREPIRVDVTPEIISPKETISMRNFDFNPPIPQDAFSMDIPAGYTVRQMEMNRSDIDAIDKNVTDLLRDYTDRSGGKFPPKLDDITVFANVAQKNPSTQPAKDAEALGLKYELVYGYLFKLPRKDWGYLGDGKSIGNGGTLIFWYKSANGYRGLYADLSMKDLAQPPK